MGDSGYNSAKDKKKKKKGRDADNTVIPRRIAARRDEGERITAAMASDVGERGRGDQAHGERAREVVVLAAALVAEVERVLLLPLVGVAEQDHLTQEGVHDHVLVVDLFDGGDEGGGGGGREKSKQ